MFLLAIAFSALAAGPSVVEQTPQPPPTFERTVFTTWKALHDKPKTRASVVQEMEVAIAASYPLVEKSPQPFLVGWVDHQAEHYGKLVSNYRMNGLVPPISRR